MDMNSFAIEIRLVDTYMIPLKKKLKDNSKNRSFHINPNGENLAKITAVFRKFVNQNGIPEKARARENVSFLNTFSFT